MNSLPNNNARLTLKPAREKSLLNRHPWIFSGAVAGIEGLYHAGDIINIFDSRGKFRGKGFLSPKSQIRVRMVAFDEEEISDEFWRQRLRTAFEFRQKKVGPQTNAFRVVNAEADNLPGLIIDCYHGCYVVQIHSLGMDRIIEKLVQYIRELFQPLAIYERSDSAARREEGLPSRIKWWLGSEENGTVIISENGIKYEVDLAQGQKTGFFLDQRENRRRVGQLSEGKSLLNCFSYTGGFSLTAAKVGAATVSVEISKEAQKRAQKNFELNQLDLSPHKFITESVFDYLRTDSGPFDVVALDPPAFVKSKKHVNQGARAYKDINRLAMRKVNKDGFLLSCSCSHFVNWDLFQKILFSAAVEAKREVQIVGRYGSPPDHPISLFFPEGEYLKTFLLRVF